MILDEAERGTGGKVGGIENNEGPTMRHVGKVMSLEDVIVVILLGQITPTVHEDVRPVPRSGDPEQDISLDVALQYIPLEALKKPVLTEETQVCGREASSRNGRDHVDFI